MSGIVLLCRQHAQYFSVDASSISQLQTSNSPIRARAIERVLTARARQALSCGSSADNTSCLGYVPKMMAAFFADLIFKI